MEPREVQLVEEIKRCLAGASQAKYANNATLYDLYHAQGLKFIKELSALRANDATSWPCTSDGTGPSDATQPSPKPPMPPPSLFRIENVVGKPTNSRAHSYAPQSSGEKPMKWPSEEVQEAGKFVVYPEGQYRVVVESMEENLTQNGKFRLSIASRITDEGAYKNMPLKFDFVIGTNSDKGAQDRATWLGDNFAARRYKSFLVACGVKSVNDTDEEAELVKGCELMLDVKEDGFQPTDRLTGALAVNSDGSPRILKKNDVKSFFALGTALVSTPVRAAQSVSKSAPAAKPATSPLSTKAAAPKADGQVDCNRCDPVRKVAAAKFTSHQSMHDQMDAAAQAVAEEDDDEE